MDHDVRWAALLTLRFATLAALRDRPRADAVYGWCSDAFSDLYIFTRWASLGGWLFLRCEGAHLGYESRPFALVDWAVSLGARHDPPNADTFTSRLIRLPVARRA